MKIMNSIFPFIDIIILGLLAVFLGFRLKNLLGDKSGYKENITNEKNTRGTSLENKKVVSIHETKAEGHGFSTLKKADPNFSEKEFKDGAKEAFKQIVTAYSDSDLTTLRHLLGYDLFQSFSKAIAEIEAHQNTQHTKIHSIDKIEIDDVSVFDNIASITCKIVSLQTKFIKDSKDNIIEGNEKTKEKINDKWTFERDVSSINPNWKLVETDTFET